MEPWFSCFYSYLLYGICVKIFIVNRYTCISKSYTTTKNTIDRQYTKRGKLQCQLLLIIGITGPPTTHFKFITKCDNCYYKVRQLTIISLQSATCVITKYGKYHKVRQFYYKVRWELKSATIITRDNRTKLSHFVINLEWMVGGQVNPRMS